MVFIIKFKLAPIFTMIFVISASKYVSIRSSNENGGQIFPELHLCSVPVSTPKVFKKRFNMWPPRLFGPCETT